MIVNDMIKTYGYVCNRLNHFVINIFYPETERWIIVKQPTPDEYIYLCDREIVEWLVDDENDIIGITIDGKPNDMEIFHDRV